MQIAYNVTGRPLTLGGTALLALHKFRASGRPQLVDTSEIKSLDRPPNAPLSTGVIRTRNNCYDVKDAPPWLRIALRHGIPLLTTQV